MLLLVARTFSTSGGSLRPSAVMRSARVSTPRASQVWKGPNSQLKPQRIARSMLTISSAISSATAAAVEQGIRGELPGELAGAVA